MRVPIYQVDAFTSDVFSGNPAAVCLLNDWIRRLLTRLLYDYFECNSI
jgi:predicted PhzF superfamily epimerase YddE/YHI9